MQEPNPNPVVLVASDGLGRNSVLAVACIAANMRIDVAPAADGWQPEYPCGCGQDGRCDQHATMMRTIREFWDQPMTAPVSAAARRAWSSRAQAVWAHSNGYGEPGRIPAQGYDWSGIRDSTPTAVERMYAEVTHA